MAARVVRVAHVTPFFRLRRELHHPMRPSVILGINPLLSVGPTLPMLVSALGQGGARSVSPCSSLDTARVSPRTLIVNLCRRQAHHDQGTVLVISDRKDDKAGS